MNPVLSSIGAIYGLAAVALGAFGAHALEGQVEPSRIEVWNTAAHYLGWQGTALLALAATGWCAPMPDKARRLLSFAGWTLMLGTLIFSGSLFVLVLSGIGIFGAITPIGGVLMILGWALALASLIQIRAPNDA
jgi:uncharacterized membrane protein YgdD (TMEM256/DUF423 family)